MASALLVLASLVLLSLPFARAIDIGPIPLSSPTLSNAITIPVSLVEGDPLAITLQNYGGSDFKAEVCLGNPTPDFVSKCLCVGLLATGQGNIGTINGYDATGTGVAGIFISAPFFSITSPITWTITYTTQWEVVLSQGANSVSFTYGFISDTPPSVANTLFVFTGVAATEVNVVTTISFPQAVGRIAPSSSYSTVPVTGFSVGQSATLTISGNTGHIFFGGPIADQSVGIGFLVGTPSSYNLQLVSVDNTGYIYYGQSIPITTQPFSITTTVVAEGYSVVVQQGTNTRNLCWPRFYATFPSPSSTTNIWFVGTSLRVHDVILS